MIWKIFTECPTKYLLRNEMRYRKSVCSINWIAQTHQRMHWEKIRVKFNRHHGFNFDKYLLLIYRRRDYQLISLKKLLFKINKLSIKRLNKIFKNYSSYQRMLTSLLDQIKYICVTIKHLPVGLKMLLSVQVWVECSELSQWGMTVKTTMNILVLMWTYLYLLSFMRFRTFLNIRTTKWKKQ